MNNYINNVRISKVQYLNVNFGNVIDISTFIDNYKKKGFKYGYVTTSPYFCRPEKIRLWLEYVR